MIDSARTFKRPAGKRRRKIRTAKTGSAAQAIGQLQPGAETFVLTFGQFSIIDALVYLLQQTGPANVDIATWTAAEADLEKVLQMFEAAEIDKARFVVDKSFLNRQPAAAQRLVTLFGSGSIRAIRTHSKFLTIRNARWNLVVRTSMNLNENRRLENLEISDDTEFAQYFGAIVDDIFQATPAEDWTTELPGLDSRPNSHRPLVDGKPISIHTLKQPQLGLFDA